MGLGLLHCLPFKQHWRIHKIKKERKRKPQFLLNTNTTGNRLQRGMQIHIWSFFFPLGFFFLINKWNGMSVSNISIITLKCNFSPATSVINLLCVCPREASRTSRHPPLLPDSD